jgi:hypothetical protein
MNRSAFVLAAAALAVPAAAAAQSSTPPADVGAALTRLFGSPEVQPSWFSADFLKEIPIDRVREITKELTGLLGPFRSVTPNVTQYAVTFEHGSVQAEGMLDKSGAFMELLLSRMQCELARKRLTDVFGGTPPPPDLFDTRFLNGVPIDRIRSLVKSIIDANGTLTGVVPQKNGSYDLAFTHGHAGAVIFLDGDGQIAGLLVQPPPASAPH